MVERRTLKWIYDEGIMNWWIVSVAFRGTAAREWWCARGYYGRGARSCVRNNQEWKSAGADENCGVFMYSGDCSWFWVSPCQGVEVEWNCQEIGRTPVIVLYICKSRWPGWLSSTRDRSFRGRQGLWRDIMGVRRKDEWYGARCSKWGGRAPSAVAKSLKERSGVK